MITEGASKVCRLMLALLLFVGGLLGALRLPAFADDNLISYEDIESFNINLLFEGFTYSTPQEMDISVDDSVTFQTRIYFKTTPPRGSKLVFDFPYGEILDNKVVPLLDSSKNHNGEEVGTCEIKDGRLIFNLTNPQSRFTKIDLPITFSEKIKELARQKGVNSVNLPIALPKAQIHIKGGNYPKDGAYPSNQQVMEPTINDAAISDPNAFSLKLLSQNVDPDRADLQVIIGDQTSNRLSNKKKVPINKPLTAQFQIANDFRFKTQGISKDSILEYEIPKGIEFEQNQIISFTDKSGEICAQGSIQDNKIRIVFIKRCNYESGDITASGITMHPSKAVVDLLQSGEAQSVGVPIVWPHSNVNYRPHVPLGDTGRIRLTYTPSDFKIPDLSINEPISDSNIFSLVFFDPSSLPVLDTSPVGNLYNSDGYRISANHPVVLGENFLLDFWVNNLPAGPKGSIIRYPLPSTVTPVGENKNIEVAKYKEGGDYTPDDIFATASIVNGNIEIEYTKDIPRPWSSDFLSKFQLTYNSSFNTLFKNSDNHLVAIPFGIPGAKINGITLPRDSKTPLPPVAENNIPTSNEYVYIPVLNKENMPIDSTQPYATLFHKDGLTIIGESLPLIEDQTFKLRFGANSFPGAPAGSIFKFPLPDTISAVDENAEIDVMRDATNEKVGTAIVKDGYIQIRLTKAITHNANLELASMVDLRYNLNLNSLLRKPFIERINIPFGIPGTKFSRDPGVEPILSPAGKDFSLPPVTENTTLIEHSDQYVTIPVLKKPVFKDELKSPDPKTAKDYHFVEGDLAGDQLLTDFKITFNGKPLSEAEPYNEVDKLTLSGTFKSIDGVEYKGKKLVFTIPSNAVSFKEFLTDQKIIDPVSKLEIGTITINQKQIILQFTTDIDFTGRITTDLQFGIRRPQDKRNLPFGTAINVPFTLLGAKVEDKQQPAHLNTETGMLPEPTFGSEQPNVSKDFIILHPTTVRDAVLSTDGKSGNWYKDNYIDWSSGIQPIYTPTETDNTFIIAYDLPWDGQQPNTDYYIALVKGGNSSYDPQTHLKIKELSAGPVTVKELNNAVISIKRVWFKTDSDGQPIMEKKNVPIMGPDGNFIPNYYTTQKVLVPLGAVETALDDPNPPAGFDVKSPCGFVVRAANIPIEKMKFVFTTKITDLDKIKDLDNRGRHILKNRWVYGQQLYDKNDIQKNYFFKPNREYYDASAVRTLASAEGDLIFGGKLKVKKVAAEDKSKHLAGARFALMTASGEPSFDKYKRPLNNLITNEQGELCMIEKTDSGENLIPLSELSLLQGTDFTLKETEAPEGYNLPDNPVTTLNITEEEQVITITNELDQIPPKTGLSNENILAGLLLVVVLGVGLSAARFLHIRRAHS